MDLIAQTEEKRKRGASQEKMRKQSGNFGNGQSGKGNPPTSRGGVHRKGERDESRREGGDRTGAKVTRSGAPAKPSHKTPREADRHGAKPQTRREGKRQEAEHRHDSRPRIGLFGLHAVEAALLNPLREIRAVYVTEAAEEHAYKFVDAARSIGLDRPEPVIIDAEAFDRALPKATVHQGIGLDCSPLDDTFLPDLIHQAEARGKSLVVLLDQVTDPHNLGAIIRSACAFGADGVIVQTRHAPEITGIVAKTASGALEHVPVLYETNLARAIDMLKDAGFFAIALDERGEKTLAEAPKFQKTLLVLGAEGPGLRPLVREKCDVLLRLPTSGKLSSLNVSNAAAIALYGVSGGN